MFKPNRALGVAAGVILVLLLTAPASRLGAQDGGVIPEEAALARRQAWLTHLLGLGTSDISIGRLNAVDETWEDWVARTGELPPDFVKMRAHAMLSDPLVPLDRPGGARIQTAEEWTTQRGRIRQEFERWIYGTMPPAPDNLRATVVDEHRAGDTTVQNVLLEFGPGRRATLRVQLIVPPGDGPFPVFMTNHPRRRPWVNTAVRRGYLACIVYAMQDSDDSDAWIELYPEHDFSMLGRWAWGAMRAVDYLTTRSDVNAAQIAITGHSRNSKSALLAAAFDERIAAVVPSRGNNGDQIPWRFASDVYASQSLDDMTGNFPNWFHPRLRFFAGNEHRLPVDQHVLLALVAPRGLMFSHAFTEHQGNVLGIEESYRSVKSVYEFLGHPERLGLYQQPGEHASSPEDVEVYLDFFDNVFGRGSLLVPRMWVRNYSFDRWLLQSGESLDPRSYPVRRVGDFMTDLAGRGIHTVEKWLTRRASIQNQIRWALGHEPAGVPLPPRTEAGGNYSASEGYLGALLAPSPQNRRSALLARSPENPRLVFGDNLRGEIHSPADFDPTASDAEGEVVSRRPAVIWLHPYSYGTGYARSFGNGDARFAMWEPLLDRGFVVATFDQIGFGSRIDGALKFYDRYPNWSLLGRMVVDVQGAVSTLSSMDGIDAEKIYVMGYGLGGKIGLVTASLDERVAGVVAISSFAPLRLDTPAKGTEGVRHYSHLHGLMPKLGFFEGHEDRLPIDWDEILAAVAPRPVWIGAPTFDRFNPVDDVRSAVEEARKAYGLFGADQWPAISVVDDFRVLPDSLWREGSDWLAEVSGLPQLEVDNFFDGRAAKTDEHSAVNTYKGFVEWLRRPIFEDWLPTP